MEFIVTLVSPVFKKFVPMKNYVVENASVSENKVIIEVAGQFRYEPMHFR